MLRLLAGPRRHILEGSHFFKWSTHTKIISSHAYHLSMSRFLHGIKFEEPTLIWLAPTFVLVAQLLDALNSFWCHDLPHLLLVRNNQVVFNTLLNCLFFFIFSFCLAHLFLYLESSIGKEEQNIVYTVLFSFDCHIWLLSITYSSFQCWERTVYEHKR